MLKSILCVIQNGMIFLCISILPLGVFTQDNSIQVDLIFPSKHDIKNVNLIGIYEVQRNGKKHEIILYSSRDRPLRSVKTSHISRIQFKDTLAFKPIAFKKGRKPSQKTQNILGIIGSSALAVGGGFAFHSSNQNRIYKQYTNEYHTIYANPNLSRNSLHKRSNKNLAIAASLGLIGFALSGYHYYMKREYILHKIFGKKKKMYKHGITSSYVFLDFEVQGFQNLLTIHF